MYMLVEEQRQQEKQSERERDCGDCGGTIPEEGRSEILQGGVS